MIIIFLSKVDFTFKKCFDLVLLNGEETFCKTCGINLELNQYPHLFKGSNMCVRGCRYGKLGEKCVSGQVAQSGKHWPCKLGVPCLSPSLAAHLSRPVTCVWLVLAISLFSGFQPSRTTFSACCFLKQETYFNIPFAKYWLISWTDSVMNKSSIQSFDHHK